MHNYKDPFRRAWEWVPIVLWGVTVVYAVSLMAAHSLPSLVLYAVAGVALMLGLRHVPEALRLTHRRGMLKGQPLSFCDLSALEEITRKNPNMIWLGKGFDWGQDQAQMCYEVIRRDPAKMPNDGEMQLTTGQRWIHGLCDKEIDLLVPCSQFSRGVLIVGTTGSGKTRLYDHLIAQAILRGEVVIVFDPKGDKDLRRGIQATCERMGRADAFVMLHPGFPSESVRFDPLRNFNRTTGLASRIATLIPSDSGADPFSSFSQSALNKIIQAMLVINEKPSIVTIRRILETGAESLVIQAIGTHCARVMGAQEWEEWVNRYAKRSEAGNEIKLALAYIQAYKDQCRINRSLALTSIDGIISSFTHDKAHFGKMITSLLPVLDMLTTAELGPLLSPDPTDLDDKRQITDFNRIINNKQVLYLGLDSLSDNMVGAAIGSLLLADLTSVAGDRYNYGEKLAPINVFVDEAAEVLNEPFVQMLNKGRGAEFRCAVATQTFADFEARAGNRARAEQILENLNTKFSLQVNSAPTQKYITDNFPQTVVRHIEYSQSNAACSATDLHFKNTTSEKLTETEAPLFPPTLLGCLPPLEFFANVSGGRVIKGRIPILNKQDAGARASASAA